ncbi:MAG: glycosyltransferase [Chloroflexota bacterium]
MKISTLICTYNRPDLLQKALYALLVSTSEKPDQVVVVNGGDEQADRVVESYTRPGGVEIKLVKVVNKTLAANRNAGLPHCSGEIIAMTDDDAEVFPDWVSQMKRLHTEHPEAGAVGGPVIGKNAETITGKVADAITFPSWREPGYVRTLPGVNIAYKRAVVDQVGAQDEQLCRGEDVDFNWRVKQLGYEIYFHPAVKVYHYHRPSFRGLLNQQYMYGRAYTLVRRKWPEMYCIYPHGLRRPKDLLKAGNFFAGLFYQPFLTMRKITRLSDRLTALPLLFASGAAWRAGMISQSVSRKRD